MRVPFALALLAAAAPAPAQLLIAPTTIEVAAGKRGAAVEITNQADTPADLQFRAFAWAQADGRDTLTPTAELAISPPLATVPPHAKQVFRVLDLAPGAAAGERNYRLLLNQLPGAGDGAIRINVEFSLPVFITPAGARPAAVWRTEAGTVSVTNAGARRLRVGKLALRAPDGREVAPPDAAGAYLLAGATRRFALPPGAAIGAGARLVGWTDGGPIDEPLVAVAAR